MNYFKYLYRFTDIPPLLWRVKSRLGRQRDFLNSVAMTGIMKHCENQDGTIDEEDLKKIEKYYGLAVPAILGEAYADLRGKPLSERERTAATFLGASTGLFDDFFDKKELTDEYVKNLYTYPETFTGQNSNEQLCNYCWTQALTFATSKSLLLKFAAKVHEAQIESRKQVSADVAPHVIREITFDKGGFSVIFYLALFYDKIPYEDEYLFYNVGALLQLENDLFDVYKDSRANINTLVTMGEDMELVYALYADQWKKVCLLIKETAYPAKGKKAFASLLAALVSRGFVCLQMLQKRQKENNGKFDPHAFSRKQLICDMEKPINLIRTIGYYGYILQNY
jgi:hypothetical protein